MRKFNYMLIFITLLIAMISVAVAADVNDSTEQVTTTGVTQYTTSHIDSQIATNDNSNEITKKTENNMKESALNTPKTVTVDSTNYNTVFLNDTLNSTINDGDTIDVQEDIIDTNLNITINKAINLTTTTGAKIYLNTTGGNLLGTNPGNSFKIVNSGSYTNVTNLKFYNTQVFVINAHHVTMDNINVTVENRTVGSGVGVTSIRDNSTYVTVKNSNFYTKNNGGSSSLVLAWADYCTIDNNNITGEGNVGNLMYLTTYNINGTPEYAVDINMYNNITNNNIKTVSVTGSCIGVVVTGHDNKFENNKVNVSSSFAGQWMSPTMNEQGDHDDRWEGNSYINNKVYGSFTGTKNSTIMGNTFHSSVSLPERCIFKNNNAENSTVNVNGANCDLYNNTINILNIGNSANPTYVCTNNVISSRTGKTRYIINYDPPNSLDGYTLNNPIGINKKFSSSVKTEGETKVVTITESNFEEWFGDDPTTWELIYNKIDSSTIFNISYVPETVTNIWISPMGVSDNFKDYTISFVGNNLTLTNVFVYIKGYHFVLSDFNLVYDDNYIYDDDIGNDVAMVLGDMGNDYSFLVDNVNINFSPEYSSEDPILQVLYVSQPNSNITYQNSEININVPVTDDGIPLFEFCKKVKFINNTINIHETMESGDDLLLTAFYAGQSNPRMSTDENEFENNIISIELPDDSEAEVCAIQLLSSNNILNNNTITITSNANAKAIELIGNNNTVIDNLLMANTLTGDDAVNATGENNVVENNTAPEMDTRIPTSIELSYDVAPIDVGQRLVIRGVFKADGVEASAEGIKIYDNNELLTTISTSDEFGTITYAYTPTVGGSHNLTFAFDANDTHSGSTSSIIVEVNGPSVNPIINITTDNFYDYFNEEGELYSQNISCDTIYYFYSVPEEVSQIALTKSSNSLSKVSVIFAGTENFTLTNKAIIMSANPKEFKLVNMTIVFDDDYDEQDYIFLEPITKDACIIDNCNITANVTRKTPIGYPYSVISTDGQPVTISNSDIVITTVESAVDWEPSSQNYGNNNIIPIYTKSQVMIVNNTIQIVAQVDESMYPTLYGIRIAKPESVMTNNNITINGGGWLYAIQPTASNVEISNNHINISGINYTAGIMMENVSNNTIDNNTIILSAATNRQDMETEPCTYGITVIDYLCTGSAYRVTGNAVNNKITNNNITCTAYNMYGIEEFGGSNTTIENNTFVATGDTAMAIGVIASNVLINNNNVEVNGNSYGGTTVDYLGAKTTGVYVGRGTNITVTNNNINSTFTGIIVQAQNIADIQNNNITSTNYNYTVELDTTTNNTTVTNNYLITPDFTGDKSVSNDGNDNTIENNTPLPVKSELIINLNMNAICPIDLGGKFMIRGYVQSGSESPEGVNLELYDNDTFVTNIVTKPWGTIEYDYTPTTAGNRTLTLKVNDENYYGNNASVNAEVIEPPKEYSLKVDTTEFTFGTNASITASIYYGNEYGEDVASDINKGKVVFKVNGKTLKDANGKVIYAKVINGTATIENYTIPSTWKENSTIEAVYSGSSDLAKISSEKQNITLIKEETTLTTTDATATAGSTITLNATINSSTQVTGKVVFKVNGKTVKDANGKVIYAKVVNNTVSVEYTLPESMKAGSYNITAVLISSTHNKLEDVKTLTVS